jgi:hypothetical protein
MTVLIKRFQNRRAPFFELIQLFQSVANGADGHLVQAARGFLSVAGD